LRRFEHQVRHDAYRMTQFVRFRKVESAPTDYYIAWHRPDHDVMRVAAPFFVKRFAVLTWSILTPDASAHWNRERLTFGPGVPRQEIPDPDELESLWRTYYASTCNPARINPRAMTAQMPKRFWMQLPEAREITPLLSQASGQAAAMVKNSSRSVTAAAFVPDQREWPALAVAARACQGCELHGPATQTVFGVGPKEARIMLVGEQPGDEEDRHGLPFVGPAGTILDQALADARLDRNALYLTNAVKHFRFTPAGRTRRHQTPRPSHIVACRPWLDAEVALIQPRVIVCLGATAARSLLGYAVRVTEQRGTVIPMKEERRLLVTIHPAAVLRAANESARKHLYRLLVADLQLADGESLRDSPTQASP
jgi:DNA polymerase